MNSETSLEYVWLIANEVVTDLSIVDNLDDNWVTDTDWGMDLNISEVLDRASVIREDVVIDLKKE